ncbi:MAG TPA: ImcF-related family protein, partial [Pyrinomonadaceae bacterium]|nr:ImcF-related family protein [Pyrinomonadaceae bacterium]
ATFPIDSAENAQALFDGEFEKLSEALMRRRIIRLSAPFPPLRQLRIFNFPLHFNSARRKFGTFVNALFRPSPFSQNPLLRGFYFTAAVPQKASGAQPQTLTASYFIKRLFREVFLRDKDIAAIFIAQRQRPPILGWVLTALGALLVLAALVMSTVSLFSNRQLLAEAVEVGDRVLTIIKADTGKNPLDKKEDETRKEINAIKDMQQLLERLDDYDRNSPPLYLRFGMYSGSRIYKKSLLPIYFSIVEQRFKKPTISALEAELRKFANSPPVANPAQLTQQEEQNLARHYDLLKAYLMLSGEYKDKADSTDIVNALRDFWVTESKVPPDMKLVAQQQLEFWAKQIDRDDDDFKFPRIALDGKLVADTRNKLKDFPAAYRYYSRKVTEISRIVDDKVGKTSVNEILTRNAADTGFLEGSYTVPGAFTRAGFDLMKQAIQEADKKLGEDDWVMGEVGKNTLTKSTDSAMILDRYYRDYADHWRNFVKATHIRKYQNKDDATQALLVLSQANSPLEILMREIAKNTNLSAKPEAEGWIDKILSYIMPAKTTETGGSQPEKEFRPLFTFVGTKEQAENAPIEKYRNELSTLYKALSRVSNDKLKEIASEIAKDDDNTLKIRAREGNINNLLVGFSETPSAQEVANLLQEPIGNLRSLLGVDFKAQTAKVWTQEILPAAKEIEKGYPFDDSQSDADLTKIAAYLNPVDGKFTKFYKDRLERYFEEADGQLRVKKDSEMQFTDEFVKYLNQVRTVQKALFGNSPTPKFEYEFSIRPAKDALIEVTIDGQKTTNEGTGSLKGTFPAAGSAETGVKISLASTAGTVGSANTTGTGSSDSKVFPGNWGLFRFVDSGNPQKQSGGEYLLSYSVGGKTLVATIRPSGGDPFDKRIYRELRAPNAIWK